MSRHSSGRCFFTDGSAMMLLVAVLLLLLGCWSSTSSAQQPPESSDARIDAHLRAGEFAPAIRLAREISDPRKQDGLLSKIAAAQAEFSATDAITTASYISDDRTRSGTLQRLRSQPLGGGAMGGSQADFDQLIDLITTTIRPESWDEVGGPGTLSEFEGGVLVDAQGVLRKVVREDSGDALALLRESAAPRGEPAGPAYRAQQSSPLRKVSLQRLERAVQLRAAAGQVPTEEMRMLAGIERVEYVLVYPQTGDIVLAGRAGAWKTNSEGRIVSAETGRPVLQLDDLVVLLRHAFGPDAEKLGCSITPTQDALARTQKYINTTASSPLRPGQRGQWLAGLRNELGLQEIEVNGVEPETRVARVMVEADYHMKLIGMGLEEGILGVKSYLHSIVVPKGAAPPPMDVLRWWFTLNYSAVTTTPERNAFAVSGQGVKVLSENELLTELGQRVHTGGSNEQNAKFAHDFTQHFAVLSQKYPIYAELRNICDLALISALIRAEKLHERTGWHMTHFGPDGEHQVARAAAPRTVETVINHRVVNRVHILAGVSGGVSVRPQSLVSQEAIQLDTYGALPAAAADSRPQERSCDVWWWD